MLRLQSLVLLSAVVAVVSLSGCSGCGSNSGPGIRDGSGTGDSGDAVGSAGGAGAATTGGSSGIGGSSGAGGTGAGNDSAAQCLPAGATCVTDMGCCSGACDPVTKVCRSSIASCNVAGTPCSIATECCNLSCEAGRCGTAACTPDGQMCTSGAACCGGSCQGGLCRALNNACKTAGNPCAAAADCCSRLCQAGKCALGASYCIQPGDVCYRSTDCCTGYCSIATGASAGVCQAINTTGSGNCTQDGIACEGCTSCCSRQCAPFALSGVKICQPASGCRLTNNLCQKDTDCCGGDPMAMTENPGNVSCQLDPAISPALGTCNNPNGCQPRGNVCGRRDGTNLCGGNAREDCCDCPPPKFNCCKGDGAGIFRCFGGGGPACPTGYTGKAPCCIAAGERCQFSAECCDGTPCVPDGQGILRCLARPPTGTACVASSGACTTTGDCCRGLTCNITPGQTYGSCATVQTGDSGPPAPGGDGGAPMPDAAVCGFHGQSCSTTSACCAGLQCLVSGTITACDDQSPCVCLQIIQ